MSIYFLPQKPVFLLNELNKIKFCSFYLKYYIFSEFFQIVLIILSSQTIYQKQNVISYKKEARKRASPPAAGRFCGKILYRRMAIPAERFYFIGLISHKKYSRAGLFHALLYLRFISSERLHTVCARICLLRHR